MNAFYISRINMKKPIAFGTVYNSHNDHDKGKTNKLCKQEDDLQVIIGVKSGDGWAANTVSPRLVVPEP
jgi:hypothetical protein